MFSKEKAVLRALVRGQTDEGLALLWHHGLDPNAPRFGPRHIEPLLHALAPFGGDGATCLVLRTRAGADPTLRNHRGETPLALALYHHLCRCRPVERARVAALIGHVGGDVCDAARGVATLMMRTQLAAARGGHELLGLLRTLREAGLVVGDAAEAALPLLHLFAAVAAELHPAQQHVKGVLAIARRLLDDLGEDPLERDGRDDDLTLLQRAPLLRQVNGLEELLRDAFEPVAPRALAVMMGVHPRLGAASPLRVFFGQPELLRALVVEPYLLGKGAATRHRSVSGTRVCRVEALARAEGLVLDPRDDRARLDRYALQGAPFDPADFRRAHFLRTLRETSTTTILPSTARLLRRLARHGVDFAVPYSPAYAARARVAALQGRLVVVPRPLHAGRTTTTTKRLQRASSSSSSSSD